MSSSDSSPESTVEQDITRYVAGDMAASERGVFEARLLTDDALAEALYADQSLANALRDVGVRVPVMAGGDDTDPGGGSEAPSQPIPITKHWAFRTVLPLAAFLAVALALPRLMGSSDDAAPVFRGGEQVDAQAFDPQGPVEEFPQAFTWPPFDGASSYRFELSDPDGQRVFWQLTMKTTASVPPNMAKTAAAGGSWLVIPLGPSGQELTAGTPVFFRVE